MSTKTVLAVAATVAVLASTTEAKKFINRPDLKFKHKHNSTKLSIFDEEEGWTVNAGVSGQGGKPAWQVGVSGSWEEEQKLKDVVKKSANILIKAQELGLLEEEAVEAQGLGKTLKKAADVLVTAQQLGLLEEESEEQKFKIGKALKNVAKAAQVAAAVGLLEEEEEQKVDWSKVKNGLSTAATVASKAKELGLLEEEEEQKFKLGKALKKAAKVAQVAAAVGLLEEEEEQKVDWSKVKNGLSTAATVASKAKELGLLEEEEEQKFKIGKALKKAANVAVKAQQLGLLDEDFEEEQKWKGWKKIENVAKKAAGVAVQAKEAGLFEEEEQILGGSISCQAYPNAPYCVALRQQWALEQEEAELEQKWKGWKKIEKAAKKAAGVAIQAKEAGLFEEEDWAVEAGISGQGGRPSWNVGVSHSWDEEELEQKWKGWKKIEKAAKKAAGVAIQAKEAGLFEEEEEQKLKLKRVIQAGKIAAALLEENY